MPADAGPRSGSSRAGGFLLRSVPEFVITAIAGICTGVVLFRVVKRQSATAAPGFATTRWCGSDRRCRRSLRVAADELADAPVGPGLVQEAASRSVLRAADASADAGRGDVTPAGRADAYDGASSAT
jgi:hypothetical protein